MERKRMELEMTLTTFEREIAELEARGVAKGRELGMNEGRELGMNEGREIGLTEGRKLGMTDSLRRLVPTSGSVPHISIWRADG